MWLWTGKKGKEDNKHMMKCAVDDVIVPAAIARRDFIVRSILNPPWDTTTPPPSPQQLNEAIRNHRIVLTVDGEYHHLTSLVDYFNTHDNDLGIDIVKFSAACSKTQQPADVSSCFRVFKKRVNSTADEPAQIEPNYMQYLQHTALKAIPATSRKSYLDFFRHLPLNIGQAFTPSNILGGFLTTGLCPVDPETILLQCTTTQYMTEPEFDMALRCVETLAPVVTAHGQLREADLDGVEGGALKTVRVRLLEDLISPTKGKSAAPIEQRPINHRRALVLNRAVILQAQEAVAAKAAAKVHVMCMCGGWSVN